MVLVAEFLKENNDAAKFRRLLSRRNGKQQHTDAQQSEGIIFGVGTPGTIISCNGAWSVKSLRVGMGWEAKEGITGAAIEAKSRDFYPTSAYLAECGACHDAVRWAKDFGLGHTRVQIRPRSQELLNALQDISSNTKDAMLIIQNLMGLLPSFIFCHVVKIPTSSIAAAARKWGSSGT